MLPQHLVYFGRTAALIEGVGTRYDPYFQAVPVASPVILRMRSRILRSLGEPATPSVAEVATVAGYAIGKAARWLVDLVKPANGNDSHARKPGMKTTSVVKAVALAGRRGWRLPVARSRAAQAQPTPLPTVEQQIAAAVLALPKEMQAGATVMGYRTAGKLETIRAGKNGMICLALFAVEKDFHVACYQDGHGAVHGARPRAARAGREGSDRWTACGSRR